MKQIELDKLQTRLEEFGKKLTVEQCEEFRQILFSIGVLHNSVGDIYKYAELTLIPRDKPIASSNNENVKLVEKLTETTLTEVDGVKRFIPAAKQDLTSIAMTLAKNLELNLKKE